VSKETKPPFAGRLAARASKNKQRRHKGEGTLRNWPWTRYSKGKKREEEVGGDTNDQEPPKVKIAKIAFRRAS